MLFDVVILCFVASVSGLAIDVEPTVQNYNWVHLLEDAFLPEETVDPYADFVNKDEEGPVVETIYGSVKGYTSTSDRDGTPYAGYVGIPFAKPPLGPLRFQAPVPPESWTGVRNATKQASKCLAAFGNVHASEDCLYLNVYTPVIPGSRNTSPKAVMLFIYGGGYNFGSTRRYLYGPDFFMDKDVIFVTIAYRLGAFGFMSLQNEDVPGNAGIKDQILALKWVKSNIANFGGDPDRITVFGESAGSVSVHMLLLAPEAKGLFKSAIMESGAAMTSIILSKQETVVDSAFRMGVRVGCPVDSTLPNAKELLLQCLRTAPASIIATKSSEPISNERALLLKLRQSVFQPTVEPEVEGAVLSKPPEEVMRSGEFNQVPVIIGSNSREAIVFLPILKYLDPLGLIPWFIGNHLSGLMPSDIRDNIDDETAEAIAQQMKDFYFDGGPITLERRMDLIDALTDVMLVPNQKATLLLAEHSKAPVYNYLFSYDGPFNVLKRSLGMTEKSPGAAHADELGYLMNLIFLKMRYKNYSRDSTPQITIDRMTRMWTDFAKTGNPTPVVDDVVTVNWEPVTGTTHNYLDIGEELALKQGMFSERMKFWNDVYESTLHERPLPE